MKKDNMEATNHFMHDTVDEAKEYLHVQAKIIQLRTARAAGNTTASLTLGFVVLIVCLAIFSALTISAGLALGSLLGGNDLGFLALGGIYTFSLILLLAFGEKLIKRRVRNKVIASILEL